MFNDYEYMVGMHAFWWIFWVAVVIAFALWSRGVPARHDRPRETPHEMLRRRLANGEISAEEYEKRKTILDRDRDRDR